MLLLALIFELACTSNGGSVAPGDANPFCLGRDDREPTYGNEKILLDTQNYRSLTLVGLNGDNGTWLSIDFDGLPGNTEQWIETLTVQCRHNFFTCGFEAGPQDNWIITQYITIADDGVDELVFNVTHFTIAIDSHTEESFSLRSYETSAVDQSGRSNRNMYNDTGVRFLYVPGMRLATYTQSFAVSTKGLYLAVVDRGSCTSITRIVVYYNVCPEQTVNLVCYPETVAPPFSNPQDREATGVCIDNASPATPTLELQCGIGGVWDDSIIAVCSCDPGYEKIDNICRECGPHTFKALQSNDLCQPCPANSNTSGHGSTICACDSGYGRADSADATSSCTDVALQSDDISIGAIIGISAGTLTFVALIVTVGLIIICLISHILCITRKKSASVFEAPPTSLDLELNTAYGKADDCLTYSNTATTEPTNADDDTYYTTIADTKYYTDMNDTNTT